VAGGRGMYAVSALALGELLQGWSLLLEDLRHGRDVLSLWAMTV
jgi:hypothetical protein